MRELNYLVDSVMALVVGAFLLRLLLQWVRTDFRNPLAQAISRLTNPIVIPLRRALPSIGRTDTAAVVAVLAAEMVKILLLMLLGGGFAGIGSFVLLVALDLTNTTLLLYQFSVFIFVLLSWVSSDGYNAAGRIFGDLTAPLLRPLRRALPELGGLDLSPVAALLLLQVLRMVLNDRIAPLLTSLLG
ncbi:MAG: YggT family protein [Pseudomonadota bacterium]